MKMSAIICCCLLAFVLSCKVTEAINHVVVEEKSSVILPCPHPVEGKVTWSREINGNRVDVLTADGDREIRHNDPDKRYSSSADKFKSLVITVNLLDSGRYLCNNEPAVELTVIKPGQTARLTAVERTSITLTCRSAVSGSSVPTWIRENRGSYVTVSRQNEMDKHDRYSPKGNRLTITDVQPDDAGLYYCDGKPVAYLNVTKEESEILQVYPQISHRPLVVCLVVIFLLLAGYLLLLYKWMKNRNLTSSNGTNVELSVARHNTTPVSTGEDSTYQSLDPASRDQDQIYSSLT